MTATPTSRTLKSLRDDGWTADVVEKWIPQQRVRKDLYGFGDVLAFRGKETLIVQATSRNNMSSRVRKILAEPRARAWLTDAGGLRFISVVGWDKDKKTNRWRAKWRPVEIQEFVDE